MRYAAFRSIRSRLLLLVLISVLPALALVLYTGVERRCYDIEEAKDDALQVLLNLGDDFERAVESTRQFLMTLAMLPDVQNRNGVACSRLFTLLLRESPLYATIFAADSDGRVFADARSAGPFTMRNRKLLQETLASRRFCVGGYFVGHITRLRVLAFAYPVVDSKGAPRGIVVAALDLERYGRMFTGTKLPRDSVFWMSDRANVHLYGSYDAAPYRGTADPPDVVARMAGPGEGTFTGAERDGVARLYAYKRLYLEGRPSPYLYMRVGIPERRALSSARRTHARNLILLCCVLAVTLASAWLLGGRLIVRRLKALTDASLRLGKGDLTARTGLAHRDDELGRVTRAFDVMARELEQRDVYARRTDEALRKSEEKYRAIFEHAVEGIFQATPDGRYLAVNPALARMYGYDSPQEMVDAVTNIGQQQYVDPLDRLRLKATYEEQGFVEKFETQIYTKSRGRVWISMNARAVKDARGETLYYEGTTDNVTARKRTEEALRESERRYRNLTDSLPLAVTEFDGNWDMTYSNPAAFETFGYSIEDFHRGLNILDSILPDERQRAVEGLSKAPKGQRLGPFEYTGVRKDGSTFPMVIYYTVLASEGSAGVRAIVIDATEPKRAEEELRAAHQHVLDIIEFFPDATLVIDDKGKVTAWNKAMEAMTGVGKEEMLGKDAYAYALPFYGERRPILVDMVFETDERIKAFYEARREGHVIFGETYVPIKARQREAYLSATASPLFDGEGKLIGAIESIRDLTGHKRMEKELRESEERYRTVIENSNDGISVIRKGKYVYVNRKYLEIFGFLGPDEVLGEPLGLDVHEDDRERVREINARRARNEEVPERYEFKGWKRNGEALFIEVSAVLTTYGGDPVTLAFLRDVTERKNLQAQLLQVQKIEAIGTLAAGIAHDFNNILMALMGYGNLLEMKMDAHDPLRVYVEHIVASVGKAANLTQSLLTFSRKQVIELKPQGITALVKDAEKLLRRLLPEDIELRVSTGDEITIMADTTQVYQVLMNLATNARDAMPHGGVLAIETARARIDGDFRRMHGYGEPGQYVLLSVTDTGMGMDGRTKEKIFEPFFTTKEVGKGTGLGLSIVYGIVKQHNGYISVYSEDGMGTTFHVYLPAVASEAFDAQEAHEDVRGGTETILFADDNSDIRQVASHILRLAGYTVIEATDGQDAVDKFKMHPEAVDLLVFDVVMPVKNGKDAYEEIAAMKGRARVLFVSGYASDVVLDKGIRDAAAGYLPKPLSPGQLLQKVRDVLDQRP